MTLPYWHICDTYVTWDNNICTFCAHPFYPYMYIIPFISFSLFLFPSHFVRTRSIYLQQCSVYRRWCCDWCHRRKWSQRANPTGKRKGRSGGGYGGCESTGGARTVAAGTAYSIPNAPSHITHPNTFSYHIILYPHTQSIHLLTHSMIAAGTSYCIHTLPQHTLSPRYIETLDPHTLSNTFWHMLSKHTINTPNQHILSAHSISTPFYISSINTSYHFNTPSQ